MRECECIRKIFYVRFGKSLNVFFGGGRVEGIRVVALEKKVLRKFFYGSGNFGFNRPTILILALVIDFLKL